MLLLRMAFKNEAMDHNDLSFSKFFSYNLLRVPLVVIPLTGASLLGCSHQLGP
jgi:hypothetical protein